MRGRVSKKKRDDWCKVKFLEDGIILRCKKAHLRKRNGTLLARWPNDGRWYPASLLSSKDETNSSLKKCMSTGNSAMESEGEPSDIQECQYPLEGTAPNIDTLDIADMREDLVLSQSCSNSFNPTSLEPHVLEEVETSSEMIGQSLLGEIAEVNPLNSFHPTSLEPHVLEEVETSSKMIGQSLLGESAELNPFCSTGLEIEVPVYTVLVNCSNLGYSNANVGEYSAATDETHLLGVTTVSTCEKVSDFSLLEEPITVEISDNTKEKTTEPVLRSTSFDDLSQTSCPPSSTEKTLASLSSISAQEATVNHASSSKNNKSGRIWDKRYLCIFCKKYFAKLPRHFESMHKDEPRVTAFLELPQKSKERKNIIEELRNAGLFRHNCQVIKTGKGIVIPKKRPNVPMPIDNFLPCEYCSSFYAKKQLAKHVKNCRERNGITSTHGRNRAARSRSVLILPTKTNTTEVFREKVLSKMNDDEVFRAVTKDALILEFGQHLFEKLCHDSKHCRLISDRLRELGRFLLVAKKRDCSVNSLNDLLNPSKYKVIKESVREVAGFDEGKNLFQIPSLALKLGMSIKKCAVVQKGILMEQDGRSDNVQKLEDFISVFDLKWTGEMSRKAHRTLEENKWNRPKLIPLADDISKLNEYFLKKDKELTVNLMNSATSDNFTKMCEITLCRTLVLNRRRVGEIQHMILSDYQKTSENKTSDTFELLSETEKILVKTMKRVETRGKKGRKVPVLLTKDLQNSINLLIEKRKDSGIPEENVYLFPSLHNQCGFYRADSLLRKFAIYCGAKFPESLTSTKLRKHVATMSQLLNLREHELDSLAKFMGHDIRIHRQYYRLSEDTMDLAKIGKLLINMDTGNLKDMQNKNLDEIDVNGHASEDDVDSDIENVDENEQVENAASSMEQQNSYDTYTSHTSPRKRKRTERKPWKPEELQLVRSHFKGFIQLHKVPGKTETTDFLLKHTNQLKHRSWKDIKYCVYNSFKK